MKTPSADLFHLIQSLTLVEKRQFSKTCSKKSKIYEFYKLIEAQEQYDEEKIKEQIQDASFVRNLKVHKNRLFQMVLKACRLAGTSKGGVEEELLEYKHNAEIFLSKKFYALAYEHLQKAIRLGEEYEEYELLLGCYGILARQESYFIELQREEQSSLTLFRLCIARIDNYSRYAEINSKLIELSRKNKHLGFFYCQKLETEVVALLRSEIEEPRLKPLSPIAERLHRHCYIIYAMAKGEVQKAYSLSRETLSYFETKPKLKKVKYMQYYNCIINHLLPAQIAEEYKELQRYKQIAWQLVEQHPELRHSLLYVYFFAVQHLYQKKDYEGLEALWYSEGKELFGRYMQVHSSLAARVALQMVELFVVKGKAKEAGSLLMHIMDIRDKLEEELEWLLYVAEIIYHLEQEDFLLVENLIAAHQKRMRRHKMENPFIRKAFFYFRKYMRAQKQTERAELCKQFLDILPDFEELEIMRASNSFFRVQDWLQSQAKG